MMSEAPTTPPPAMSPGSSFICLTPESTQADNDVSAAEIPAAQPSSMSATDVGEHGISIESATGLWQQGNQSMAGAPGQDEVAFLRICLSKVAIGADDRKKALRIIDTISVDKLPQVDTKSTTAVGPCDVNQGSLHRIEVMLAEMRGRSTATASASTAPPVPEDKYAEDLRYRVAKLEALERNMKDLWDDLDREVHKRQDLSGDLDDEVHKRRMLAQDTYDVNDHLWDVDDHVWDVDGTLDGVQKKVDRIERKLPKGEIVDRGAVSALIRPVVQKLHELEKKVAALDISKGESKD